MEFQLLFLFSFSLELVFHEREVSSLNTDLEGIFAQRHCFMKATYRCKYLKLRIMYSNGHPGSFNPAVKVNKEAHMIYGSTNNETRSSQGAGFCKKIRSKVSGSSACLVGQL